MKGTAVLPVCTSSSSSTQQYTAVLTGFGSEVDAESSDGVLGWVSVQLGHQQIVVLHPQRKLLHI